MIDDSIQRATLSSRNRHAEAAHATARGIEGRATEGKPAMSPRPRSPRRKPALKTAQDELHKQKAAYEMDPRSVSKDALDNAVNAEAVAQANLEVAQKAARPDESRRLGLRYTESGRTIQRPRKILSCLQRTACQVYLRGAQRWSSALDQHHHREATCRRKALTTAIRREWIQCWCWERRKQTFRFAATSMKFWCRGCLRLRR